MIALSFNYGYHWRNGCPELNTTNEIKKAFVDVLNDKLLTQVVDEPTRGNNILNLIISGSPTDIEKWVICPPFFHKWSSITWANSKCQVRRIQSEPPKTNIQTLMMK